MSDTGLTAPNERAPRTGWGWILVYGLLLVATGCLALLNPAGTGLATGVFLGAVLTSYGILAIISGLSALSERGRWVEILLGALAVLAGILILFTPFAGAFSLIWALGFWLLASGVIEIGAAVKGTFDRGWRIVLGLLDMILGGWLVFSGPASGLFFLAGLIGISLLCRGLFLVVLAFEIRRLLKVMG